MLSFKLADVRKREFWKWTKIFCLKKNILSENRFCRECKFNCVLRSFIVLNNAFLYWKVRLTINEVPMIILKIMMAIMMTTMMMKLRAMVVIGNRRAGTGRSKVVDLSDTSPPATLRPSYYHNCGLIVTIVYYWIMRMIITIYNFISETYSTVKGFHYFVTQPSAAVRWLFNKARMTGRFYKKKTNPSKDAISVKILSLIHSTYFHNFQPLRHHSANG